MSIPALINRIAADLRGSMAIETAIVAPTLIIMTLGIVEVGTIVARQHELQSAANEGEIIAVATNRGAKTNVEQIRAIIQESVDLRSSDLKITQRFRCGTTEELVDEFDDCMEDDVVSSYLEIDISENYTPRWTAFGIGKPLVFSVQRMVQIS